MAGHDFWWYMSCTGAKTKFLRLVQGKRTCMMLYEEIFREFQNKKVKYIVVGGIAVNLLGGNRSTYDMDILVEMSDENLRKVASILKSEGYRVKQPVNPMDIAIKDIRENWIRGKNMKAFNFYKEEDMKEVDIIIDSPVQFKDAKKDYVRVKIGSLTIPVVSIKGLIKMKKKSGRSVDQLDIETLNAIQKLKRRAK